LKQKFSTRYEIGNYHHTRTPKPAPSLALHPLHANVPENKANPAQNEVIGAREESPYPDWGSSSSSFGRYFDSSDIRDILMNPDVDDNRPAAESPQWCGINIPSPSSRSVLPDSSTAQGLATVQTEWASLPLGEINSQFDYSIFETAPPSTENLLENIADTDTSLNRDTAPEPASEWPHEIAHLPAEAASELLSVTSDCFENAKVNTQEFELASSHTKGLVSNKLLRIYLESLENIPALYFMGRNWPYKHQSPLHGKFSLMQLSKSLDKAFDPLRRQPLSRQDSERASKALTCTIMAFASQWDRSNPQPSATSSYSGSNIHSTTDCRLSGNRSQEFGRCFQEALWHKAENALGSCRLLFSFQVVLAQLIFSWLGNPCGADDSHVSGIDTFQSGSFPNPGHACMGSGHCNYGDIAAHHLLSWRRDIISRTSPRQAPSRRSRDTLVLPRSIPRQAYLGFSVMFRFGVMYDTTSSVMQDKLPIIPYGESVFEIEDDGSSAETALHTKREVSV
jgi:hypothetical protein